LGGAGFGGGPDLRAFSPVRLAAAIAIDLFGVHANILA
jgi:hypothetical protein